MSEINKYSNAKIYKISSPSTDKYYIGSTTKSIQSRLIQHAYDYGRHTVDGFGYYNSVYDIIKFCDFKIELLESVSCNNRKELVIIEGKYITQFKSHVVNKCIAGRTIKQYRETHKEEIKQHYINNRQLILQKYKQINENKKLYRDELKYYFW